MEAKPWPIRLRYSRLERIRRSVSGATVLAPASSCWMNAGSPKEANSSSSEAPSKRLGSKAAFGNTFRHPVAIARKRSSLAGALPWTRPSWLPREMYHGTSSPAASNGRWAASSSPG